MTTLELNHQIEEDKNMGSWFHNLLQGRINNLFYKYYDEKYIAIPELSTVGAAWVYVLIPLSIAASQLYFIRTEKK